MNKKIKKLLSLFLAFVMTLGFATSAITNKNVKAEDVSIPWYVSSDGKTLVINPTGAIPGTAKASGYWEKGMIVRPASEEPSEEEWSKYAAIRAGIKTVTVEQETLCPSYSYSAFEGFTSLEEFDFTNLDTSQVYNMDTMFSGDEKLETVFLRGINTSHVISMIGLFQGCVQLKCVCNEDKEEYQSDPDYIAGKVRTGNILDFSQLDLSSVAYMDRLFAPSIGSDTGMATVHKVNFKGCNLNNVGWVPSMCSTMVSLCVADFTDCGLSSLRQMTNMFSGDKTLVEARFLGCDTSRVEDMSTLFEGCSSISCASLQELNTRSCKNFSGMFRGCETIRELDLSCFDTRNAINIADMFASCKSLETVYVTRDIYNGNIADPTATCFDEVYSLVGKAENGKTCPTWQFGYTANSTYAVIPEIADDGTVIKQGYLSGSKYAPDLKPEAVILSNSYKTQELSDSEAIDNSTSRGSLYTMLNECETGYYVRLVSDFDSSWTRFQDEDDLLNDKISSDDITGTPSAFDIAGHKCIIGEVDVDSSIALIDSSKNNTGVISCNKGNLKAEYNAEGYLPLYSSKNLIGNDVVVKVGYNLVDIRFNRGCFTFNPKKDNLSLINHAKAGFGTYTRILAGNKATATDKTISRKKALLILADDNINITDAGLKIDFENLAATSNNGGVLLQNMKDVTKITFQNVETDLINFRTVESAGALEGEIERSEALKTSIKAYAKDCLESGSTSTFFSARYYLTTKGTTEVTDKYLTHVKFNINIKSVANNDYVISTYGQNDKEL